MGDRAFERIVWFETLAIQRELWLGCGIVFLLVTIVLPILAWRRRPRTRTAQIAHELAWLVAALNLLFLISLAILLPKGHVSESTVRALQFARTTCSKTP